MKQWYMMLVGIDNGGPESGPIISVDKICLKARNEQHARHRAERIFIEQYNRHAEGYSIHLAEKSELDEIIEQNRLLAKEMKHLPFVW